jgi:hypothetical protein
MLQAPEAAAALGAGAVDAELLPPTTQRGSGN